MPTWPAASPPPQKSVHPGRHRHRPRLERSRHLPVDRSSWCGATIGLGARRTVNARLTSPHSDPALLADGPGAIQAGNLPVCLCAELIPALEILVEHIRPEGVW